MKLKTLTSTTGFIAIAVVSLVLIGLVTALGSSAQFDLTENKLYTLSEGTHAVVSKLEKPVKLHLFFSQSESRDLPELRSYARRVEETLQEMVEINPKKLSLKTIDPQAFSEQEDQAAEFGLQSVPIRPGKTLYFGLVAEDDKGVVQTIGFLQPDRETVLEYEVAQMIYRLGRSEAPQIGLMSSINMMGEFNFMSPGAAKSWVVVEQLQQLFDVKKLNPG
ncbi:MAG: GldG family protein, partial [Pseudomonadota bacterium]